MLEAPTTVAAPTRSVRPALPPPAAAPGGRWRLAGTARHRLRDVLPGRIRPLVLRLPGRRLLVVTGTTEWLRHLITDHGGVGRPGLARRAVTSVRFLVLWWRAPGLGWSGRLGALDRLASHRFRVPSHSWGPASVSVRLHDPVPLREVGAAMLRVLEPVPESLPEPPLSAEDGSGVVTVDAGLVNSRGRRRPGYAGTARLEIVGAARWPRRPARVLTHGRLDRVHLDPRALEAVRGVGAVEVAGPDADTDPRAVATLLVQLAAAGAALHAAGLAPEVAALLAPELAALVRAPMPTGGDPFEVELRSVALRRAALRHHSRLGRSPSVSAVVVSHRLDYLATIIATIAGQTYPDLEIVLGLHGVALPAAEAELVRRCGRPYQIVEVPASLSFGELMGVATGRARGRLVTKFDDDDTYGPEHVWDLVLARHYSGATLVGKGAEFVHLESLGTTVRRSSGRAEWPAEVVAGGTMLLAKGDLAAVGGWRPVPRSVDRGLINRLQLAGAHMHRTHPFGYVYHRRRHGHTWEATDEYFLQSASRRWQGLPPYPEFGAPDRRSGTRRDGGSGRGRALG